MRAWSFFIGLIGSLFLRNPGVLADTPSSCILSLPQPELVTYMKYPLTYFNRALAGHPYYTASCAGAPEPENAPIGNVLVSRDDPSTEILLPGQFDAVGTPDGHWITITRRPDNDRGLNFYKSSRFLEKRVIGKRVNLRETSPDFVDSEMPGTYQTLGRFKIGEKVIYRAIAEEPVKRSAVGDYASGLTIRDYEAVFEKEEDSGWGVLGSSREVPVGIRLLSEKPMAVCPGRKLKLPILSKTGFEFAAYDFSTRTTKLFTLGVDGKSCAEVLDLGIATGKVDFSFDGESIAFHLDSFSIDDEGRWFSGVSELVSKDVFLVKLKREGQELKAARWSRLTFNLKRGVGSWFPTFLPSGKLVVLESQAVAASGSASAGKSYAFKIFDPASARSLPYFSDAPDSEASSQFPYSALGSLWSLSCIPFDKGLSSLDLGTIPLGMTAASCRDLVLTKWEQQKERVLQKDPRLAPLRATDSSGAFAGLGQDDLLAVCDAIQPATRAPVPTQFRGKTVSTRRSAAMVFAAICKNCHQGIPMDQPFGGPNLVFSSLVQGDPKQGLLARAIQKVRTPESAKSHASALSEIERQTLLKALSATK